MVPVLDFGRSRFWLLTPPAAGSTPARAGHRIRDDSSAFSDQMCVRRARSERAYDRKGECQKDVGKGSAHWLKLPDTDKQIGAGLHFYIIRCGEIVPGQLTLRPLAAFLTRTLTTNPPTKLLGSLWQGQRL